MSLPLRLIFSRNLQFLFLTIFVAAAGAAISSFHQKPKPWPVESVPIVFWSWRTQTPDEIDVREAVALTKARAIFLRAGQIDFQDGKLRRIRPVSGRMPTAVDLHLVYNATRPLLDQLEQVEEKALAEDIAAAFLEDSQRAKNDRADVAGLQIDIDVPTRLLPRYGKTLRALRERLKPGTQLSITGLPTWMQSPDLQATLAPVDFWVPQFYGAEIPQRSDQLIPISSPRDVERFVNEARSINKEFYAGLAAYSCALLYSPSGSLISLRGDMDPSLISADGNLELIEHQKFAASSGEWRYTYRARADGMIDGLSMRAGDVLVVEIPGGESLRHSARIVRELAGDKLLGICVFRLPAHDDPATLSAAEVAYALIDKDSNLDFDVHIRRPTQSTAYLLEVENRGSAGAVGGFTIDVPVNPGSIQSVVLQRGASWEALCSTANTSQRCSEHRANVIRISNPGLRPGQASKSLLVTTSNLPAVLPVSIQAETESGAPYVNRFDISVESEIAR